MNTFVSQPQQLKESLKWRPSGVITEFIGGSSSAKKTEILMPEEFNTQEEADKFFIDYYTRQGFIQNKK
jgi:hypothetical protein